MSAIKEIDRAAALMRERAPEQCTCGPIPFAGALGHGHLSKCRTPFYHAVADWLYLEAVGAQVQSRKPRTAALAVAHAYLAGEQP
jgi:hypothetical protein